MPNGLFKAIVLSKPAVALLVLLVIIFGVYASRAVLEKRATEARITALSLEISALEREKDSLGELIEYVQTDSFIREEAREKLNLTEPGESLVVIPDVDSQNAPDSGVDPSAKFMPGTHGLGTGSSGPDGSRGRVLGDANLKLWWEYFFSPEALSVETE
ncbi:MAG: septum formation initiator family protein [Parcubacteria group bacterium]|nr:septum formation initiator family protein [Parcubacteria group bacterium]